MDYSTNVAIFLEQNRSIPQKLLNALETGIGDDWLSELSHFAASPSWTQLICCFFEGLIPEFCARWSQTLPTVSLVSAFGRLVDIAPWITEFIIVTLDGRTGGNLLSELDHQALDGRQISIEGEASDEDILKTLLGVYRLLKHDDSSFARLIQPLTLISYFQHSLRAVRYVAIRIVTLLFHLSDQRCEELISQRLGEGACNGQFDERPIDFTFLSLWERRRLQDWESLRKHALVGRHGSGSSNTSRRMTVSSSNLSTQVLDIFGTLMFRNKKLPKEVSASTLHCTATSFYNGQKLVEGLKSSKPLLLLGSSGCGKTSLINDVAQRLRPGSGLITMHINEQTDFKSLVGVNTTGKRPGTFEWHPGALTKAMQAGSWVLFEDLDRVPRDIVAMLVPVLKRRELRIAGRREVIKAAPGFRVLATVRDEDPTSRRPVALERRVHGLHLWKIVHLDPLPKEEIVEIAVQLYPLLSKLIDRMMYTYDMVLHASKSENTSQIQSRVLSSRDFLKWCARTHQALQNAGFSRESMQFPEKSLDDMFLDAVDCFAGHWSCASKQRKFIPDQVGVTLNMAPERCTYLQNVRSPILELGGSASRSVLVGRCKLERVPKSQTHFQQLESTPFSLNFCTKKVIEQVAVAVQLREPALLVGETGIGKTSSVQYLARCLNQKLVVINLSQQSESGDLLGGFKPVTVRSFVMPLKDEFDDLFARTFSHSKNQDFNEKLAKLIERQRWGELVRYWKQACGKVRSISRHHAAADSYTSDSLQSNPKRRKVDKSLDDPKKQEWEALQTKIENLEHRLSLGEQSFAFSYVEGEFVRAIRNGYWVLLDEINLASPDTLECLSELLESGSGLQSSIQLVDAGKDEKITAHPRFRMFAAMNPSTDVGKRDLPPSIRSRFSEIYVDSPDQHQQSLEDIISTYLCDSIQSDVNRRICAQVAQIYKDIQRKSTEGEIQDGTGQKPQYSLRSLTRALTHARMLSASVGIKRALYEGFMMCFSTCLDRSSVSSLIIMLQAELFGSPASAAKHLRQPIKYVHSHRKFLDIEVEVRDGPPASKTKKSWKENYRLPIGSETKADSDQYIVTPYIATNIANLSMTLLAGDYPVLIQGPTSAGKTSMIEYLARRSGNKLVRINNHEHTDLQEYIGTYVSTPTGQLIFEDGVLVEALRKGHWVVLDELNLAPTDILEALNRLLDDNRELLIPETQEVVRPHANFMLFATQNPAGAYGGRKALSRAFRNRFLELHFEDIPVNELKTIMTIKSKLPLSWCSQILEVYSTLSRVRQQSRLFDQTNFATLRDLFRWALRPADSIENLANNGFMLLAEKVRTQDERNFVRDAIERIMTRKGTTIKIADSKLYREHAREAIDTGLGGIVWTTSMCRLFSLVKCALENNEPVLLVGETGCGKTRACQVLAEYFDRSLFTVNAHQNMETSDLIGAQRPIRDREAIHLKLRRILSAVLDPGLTGDIDRPVDLASLLKEFHRLDESTKDRIDSDTKILISKYERRLKQLFEWHDGRLVDAMRQGSFFLLDEISLADDSVLERMNSVLDPQRSVLLAEKGTVDSTVVAKDGFQMLATMNPSGDFGKKELSAALRNRFTEIWVPPLNDSADAREIVSAKLCDEGRTYATQLVQFAQWFTQNYRSPKLGCASVRDLLTWVLFINERSSDCLEATKQGAFLVFIDTLGADPSGLAAAHIDPHEERLRCIKKFEHIFATPLVDVLGQDLKLSDTREAFAVGFFSLANNRRSISDISFSFEAPTTKINAMRILRALQLPKPVLLEGEPGVGKTTIVSAIAEKTGRVLTRLNLSEQTDLVDLFGSDVPLEEGALGNFTWQDAPFLTAMRQGHWVLLDEMNLASQSVLEGLNACIDHREEVFIPELGKTFPRHRDFRLFAAQNPHRQGSGRKGLPISFVNRFSVVCVAEMSTQDMRIICSHKYGPNLPANLKPVISCVNALVNKAREPTGLTSQGKPWEINLRDVLRMLELLQAPMSFLSNVPLQTAFKILLRQRFRNKSDQQLVTSIGEECLPGAPILESYYYNLTPSYFQVGHAILPRKLERLGTSSETRIIIFKDRLAVLESVMVSLRMRWPILLVGGAKAGKTSIIRSLASVTGQRLELLSMSAEVDANDLIGSYDQVDENQSLNILYQEIHPCAIECLNEVLHINKAHSYVASLTTLVQLTSQNSAEHCDSDIRKVVKSSMSEIDSIKQQIGRRCFQAFIHLGEKLLATRVRSEAGDAKFSWVEGPIVGALRNGDWLVLENANLASSAVLDRLNSLLEPDGALIVNEHCEPGGSPEIIKPHPNFRIFLTMDPKYGEISSAMRNRSVETFVPSNDQSNDQRGYDFSLPLRALDWRYAQLLEICEHYHKQPEMYRFLLERLSTLDLHRLEKFLEQCNNGLLSSAVTRNLCKSATGPLEQAITNISVACGGLYQEVASLSRINGQWTDFQPLLPAVNLPVIALNEDLKSRAAHMCSLTDMSYEVRVLRDSLASFEHSVTSRQQLGMHATGKGWNMASLSLVESLLPQLGAWRDVTAGSSLRSDGREKALVMSLIWLCWEVLHATARDRASVHSLVCYVQLAEEYCLQNSELSEHGKQLCSGVKQDLTESGVRMGSDSGSIEPLWKLWRGSLMADADQVQSLSSLKDVASYFELLVQKRSADLEDLVPVFQQLKVVASSLHRDSSPTDALFNTMEMLLSPESESAADDRAPAPLFKCSFELVSRLRDLQHPLRDQNSQDNHILAACDLLSGRPISEYAMINQAHNPRGRLDRLVAFTGFKRLESSQSPFPDCLVASLRAGMKTLNEVPIRAIRLLGEESQVLSNLLVRELPQMNLDEYGMLQSHIQAMAIDVLFAHEDMLTGQSLADLRELKAAIDADGWNRTHFRSLKLNLSSKSTKLFKQAVDAYLRPLLCENFQPGSADCDAPDLSSRLIRFAIGSLSLFLPQDFHDPAQKPMIRRSIHNRARDALITKLKQLSDIEVHITGCDKSFRSIIVEGEIEDLGPAPSAEKVFRPNGDSNTEFYIELDNIRRFVNRMASMIREGKIDTLKSKTSIADCEQIVQRLQVIDLAYQDLSIPLLGLIQSLKLGLLIGLHEREQQALRSKNRHASSPSLSIKSGTAHAHLLESDLVDIEHVYKLLEMIAIQQQIFPLDSKSVKSESNLLTALEYLYGQWKKSVRSEALKQERASSIYHYTGTKSDEDPVDADIVDMFHEQRTDHREINGQDFLKEISCRTAEKCFKIFDGTAASNKWTIQILEYTEQQQQEMIATKDAEEKMLQLALILAKFEQQTTKLSSEVSPKNYNFYADPNFVECDRLRALTTRTKRRFEVILTAWPENSIVQNVINGCMEVLNINIGQPLAKILGRVEQLYSIVHEWSSIASRELNVTREKDDLTHLIISWRRLELSTWARLLDIEDEKSVQNATSSWWFVAYESIVKGIRDLQSAEGGITHVHKVEMVSVVEGLLHSSSIGQFETRLRIIDTLRSCLDHADEGSEPIRILSQALRNIVSYFRRFSRRVRKHISDGRTAVEKNIQDIIKLASWRDSNILALKQSTRASHNKLFRQVRKYRDLLSQPCSPHLHEIVQPNLLEAKDEYVAHPPLTQGKLVETPTSLPKICQSWPPRFQTPLQTAQLMKQLVINWSSLGAHTSHKLKTFIDELQEDAQRLRKDTPAHVTEDNAAHVRYLTTRKQRLLAETLRNVQSAGMKSHHPTSVIELQDSTAKLFTRMARFDVNSTSLAQEYTYASLDTMANARRLSLNHSSDISREKVSQGLGLLESFLATAIEQRMALSVFQQQLSAFQEIFSKLQNAYECSRSDQPVLLDNLARSRDCRAIVSFMPAFLRAGTSIVESQSRLDPSLSLSHVLEFLAQEISSFESLGVRLSEQPQLPVDFITTDRLALQDEICQALEIFRQRARRMMSETVEVKPVLLQVLAWAEIDPSKAEPSVSEIPTESPEAATTNLRDALDSMLASMQDLDRIHRAFDEDDDRWLVKASTATCNFVTATRITQITEILQKFTNSLHLLPKGEGSSQVFTAIGFALPILSQYSGAASKCMEDLSVLHQSTARALYELSTLFCQVAENGFCKPSEKDEGKGQHSEKLESGTGLGGGEGAEDISKDIEPDEDMSDLAAEDDEGGPDETTEKHDDAVNIDGEMKGQAAEDAELKEEADKDNAEQAEEHVGEGDDVDAPQNEDATNDGQAEADDQMDEATGEVDDLAPSAVDEKFWDEAGKNDNRQVSGKQSTTNQNQEDQAAMNEGEKDKTNENAEVDRADDVNADSQSENLSELEEVGEEQSNALDPHVQEEQRLDLPDDLHLDGEQRNEDQMSDLESDEDVETGLENGAEHDVGELTSEHGEAEHASEAEETSKMQEDGPEHLKDNDHDHDQMSSAMKDDQEERPYADGGLEDNSAGTALGPDTSETQQAGSANDSNRVPNGVKSYEDQQKDNLDESDQTSLNQDQAQAPQIRSSAQNSDLDGADDEQAVRTRETIRKLGEAFEKWHQSRREIRETAAEGTDDAEVREDIDMEDANFEHLPDEEAKAETQVLGAAEQEQATPLKQGLDSTIKDTSEVRQEVESNSTNESEEEGEDTENKGRDDSMEGVEFNNADSSHAKPKSSIGQPPELEDGSEHIDASSRTSLEPLEDDTSAMTLENTVAIRPSASESPAAAWARHENTTANLALTLTEQLRMILEPTISTKLRGDFRTGKRLNMKRIIPYIASGYKRDKIWMRRSVPSKRAYQILLAIDDSRSMSEEGSADLAFATLALVSKSLSMLEVGELGAVGFGERTFIAHEMGMPFAAGAGEQVISRFGFEQQRTNVRELIARSIELLAEARVKAHGSAQDLWQLQFIISDGICEDHDAIRRLLMQAQEERIMIVFIVLDALPSASSKAGAADKGKNQSIIDLESVEFTEGPQGEDGQAGPMKLTRKKYLDTFPFKYFLIVRDVKDLPGVLATALRQWFAEVANT